MKLSVFSAEASLNAYIEDSNNTPYLLYTEDKGMFLATDFINNASDLTAYRKDYPDTEVTENFSSDTVAERIAADFFAKIINGELSLQNNSILIEQSAALAAEVTKRPLFKEITEKRFFPVA